MRDTGSEVRDDYSVEINSTLNGQGQDVRVGSASRCMRMLENDPLVVKQSLQDVMYRASKARATNPGAATETTSERNLRNELNLCHFVEFGFAKLHGGTSALCKQSIPTRWEERGSRIAVFFSTT